MSILCISTPYKFEINLLSYVNKLASSYEGVLTGWIKLVWNYLNDDHMWINNFLLGFQYLCRLLLELKVLVLRLILIRNIHPHRLLHVIQILLYLLLLLIFGFIFLLTQIFLLILFVFLLNPRLPGLDRLLHHLRWFFLHVNGIFPAFF